MIKINELSILMNLLSKKVNKYQIGSTKTQILSFLNLDPKKDNHYFQELIVQLSNYIKPLGLYIRYNPIDNHWYIGHDFMTSNLLSANPFEDKPKLAATLFCVLVCCLTNTGNSKINEIKNLRNKKGIIKDLKDLEEMGYVEINEKLNEVKLTSLVGYQLDIQKLFTKLTLKLKKDKKDI